jgi:hypothetical protein
MNKFLAVLRTLLPLSLGIYCLYCTFLFIFNLGILDSTFSKLNLPHILVITVVILTSGIGFELGIRLLTWTYRTERLLWLTFGFSAYVFLLQLTLTITPSISACKCTSISEAIMNILDWSKVEYSGGLFLWSIVVISIFRTKEKIKNNNI